MPNSATASWRYSARMADGRPLPRCPSNAYATGMSLYALEAAGVKPTDASYRRGVNYLLQTRLPDGSGSSSPARWLSSRIRKPDSRTGDSQSFRAAATSWAVIALAPAAEALSAQ